MKFNSQIATNRSQSERLLALGLKKETADMHWRLQPYYNDEGFDCGLEWSCNMGTFLQDDAYELFLDYILAWSLHRLIEMVQDAIVNKDGTDDNLMLDISGIGLYDGTIDAIAELIKEGYFPKEYLV